MSKCFFDNRSTTFTFIVHIAYTYLKNVNILIKHIVNMMLVQYGVHIMGR